MSLIYNYNRGRGLSRWESRREVRTIRDEIAKPRPSLAAIAAQFRAMKRLWEGKGENGLLTRREAEARLVEHAA